MHFFQFLHKIHDKKYYIDSKWLTDMDNHEIYELTIFIMVFFINIFTWICIYLHKVIHNCIFYILCITSLLIHILIINVTLICVFVMIPHTWKITEDMNSYCFQTVCFYISQFLMYFFVFISYVFYCLYFLCFLLFLQWYIISQP